MNISEILKSVPLLRKVFHISMDNMNTTLESLHIGIRELESIVAARAHVVCVCSTWDV